MFLNVYTFLLPLFLDLFWDKDKRNCSYAHTNFFCQKLEKNMKMKHFENLCYCTEKKGGEGNTY